MRAVRSLASLLTLLALSACAGDDSASTLSAEDELLLTALSGEEEALSRSPEGAEGDSAYADPMSDEAGGDRPPLMRECDAEGTYTGLFSAYDGDASGALEAPEEEQVAEARGERGPEEDLRRVIAFTVIQRVYDANDDQQLSESERNTLFADFTERCEVLHDRLVEDFDTDGDGVLSDSELQAAEEELHAREEERRAECEAEDPMGGAGGPPEGADGEGPPEGGGPDGMGSGPYGSGPDGSEPPDPRDMVEHMLLDRFDTDGDGAWSGTELADMQAELRARIVSGEHLAPEGPPPPPPAN